MPNWLLPENIADVLPSEARKIEELRRIILDNFRRYGYELVMPPLLEYLDSLLPVPGHDIDLRMFKLVDQMSGRTMGLRADMTIQVARIDAHLLNRDSVTRLCYAGSVLHTRPSGLHATREPLHIGAEIYGHAGLEADAEIQELALASLALAGFPAVRMDLSHVGIVRALIDTDEGARKDQETITALLRAKDVPGLKTLCAGYADATRSALLALPGLYGDASVIGRARRVLPALPAIVAALDDLEALAALAARAGAAAVGSREAGGADAAIAYTGGTIATGGAGITVTVDLADLLGYQYESGAMFALYVPGLPNAVARGGRYDQVGQAFGRARPATGFSMDLREIGRLLPQADPKRAIRAPWSTDPDLRRMVAALRADGEVVIQNLPGHEHGQQEFACDRSIENVDGQWILGDLNDNE